VARSRTAIFLLLFAASAFARAHAASLYDPALRFRALPTEHFVIYFHQGEDALARRLAAIAEETWRVLQRPLGVVPPKRTHVVLVDQTELANGWANPLPYDTIMVTAVWPPGSEFIGDTDDWLRMVFTHEFTHIVHLDRSEGWARVIRRIFGRMEIAFPNLFLPQWHVEGLATYEESVITGYGRLHAGDFGAIIDEAARMRRLEPLDRVNGGLTDWPNGDGAYAYGLGFHRYLADRFGAETLATLAEATARRVPFTASRVFERIYGQSLGSLWRDYEASIADPRMEPVVSVTNGKQLTHHQYIVTGPRFDRPACPTCPPDIVYSSLTPDGFPSLNRVAPDGSPPKQITRRYVGSTTAIGSDRLYFDQQEVRRNTGQYSDLYSWSRTTGHVQQLTSESRLMDPDLSPDGRTLACVQNRPGQRALVLVTIATGGVTKTFRPAIETLISEPETQFNTPRWSPDGRWIAVERHRPGSVSEIVIVDVATKTTRVIVPSALGRSVTPVWRPDGRAVVAAVAGERAPFNLFEFSLDGGNPRQLTSMSGGAKWPDISPDGSTIVFVGYTVNGFDLFTMPYPLGDAAAPRLPAVTDVEVDPRPRADTRVGPYDRDVGADPRVRPARYSPWPTLRPTSWTPIVESDSTQLRIGAATGGFDVLAYHAYSASATWLVSGPADAPRPGAATPDWNISYAYDRWRPTLFVSASNATSFFSGPATESGTPTAATLRERQLEAGVVVPIRHVRVSHVASFSMISAIDDYTLADRKLSRDRTAIRGAWATTTAHIYGYSISPEGGATIGVTAESVPRSLGSFANATAFTADARAYLPGFGAHHVLAVRAAGGVSTGDPDVRRTFHLGGAAPAGGVIDFGRSAISLLRGFGANTFAGSDVALVNADYRFPIARPQRGHGTWPLFLHTIHGTVFADAGHTWTRTFRIDAVKTSVGAELSARIVAAYFFPFIMTAGAAFGHDGSRTVSDRTTAYARIGIAF
jgi:Tol biopolymer transport system component